MPYMVRERAVMETKKKIILSVSICIIIVLIGIFVFVLKYRSSDHINFVELDLSKVDSIVLYSYSVEQVILSEKEMSELIPLLNQVELVGKWTQEFRDYDGSKYYMYQINLINGKSFDFAASMPFYIIDGERGYKVEEADYDTCNELSQKYFEFVDQYFY